MAETKLLHVEWEGPFTFGQVSDKTGEDDFGLYQIYSHHVVYGPDVLVYIGKAEQQSFGIRLNQHWDNWARPTIRLGRIRPGEYRTDDNWQDWMQLLADAERLTIFWHSPAFNSASITAYPGRPVRIHNTGKRGSLLPEYSTDWKPLRPDDAVPE